MSQATVSITYDDPLTGGSDNSQHSTWMYGTLAVSAGPTTYATGGLSTLASGGGINWAVGDYPKASNMIPKDVYFYSGAAAGSTVGGFNYTWNRANNKFQIMASQTVAAGTGPGSIEMTAATAIPANVSNDVIRFEARFIRAHSGF